MSCPILESLRRIGAPKNRPTGIAVSGGADSSALLEAAVAVWGRGLIEVIHVDHGLRSESRDEAERVRSLCTRLGVPIYLRHVRLQGGAGLERRARSLRYREFRRIAQRRLWARLLLGHHRQDQIETVAMRILRGSGPRGLAGIPSSRPLLPGCDLLRPLLHIESGALRAFLGERALPWSEDSSNRSMSTLRNRLRHRILPTLRNEDSGLDGLLLEVHHRAQALDLELDQAARALLPEAVIHRAPALLVLDIAALGRSVSAVRHRLLSRLLVAESPGAPDLRNSLFRRLESLCQAGPCAPQQLRRDIIVWRHGAELWCLQPQAFRESRLTLHEPTPLGIGGQIHLWAAEATKGAFRSAPAERVWLARSSIRGPLRCSGSVSGARYRPLGAPGRRKISDLMQESRIPKACRGQWPVIWDAEGAVWTPGSPPAQRCRLGKEGQESLVLHWEGRPPRTT